MRFTIFCFLLALTACKTTKSPLPAPQGDPVPIITWAQQTQELGEVILGEKRELTFEFTNTGNADLLIELVTSCRCTTLDWPRMPIPPGESGKLLITYDSTGQKLGTLTKTIDVIGNMDPIVAEAFFNVTVVE